MLKIIFFILIKNVVYICESFFDFFILFRFDVWFVDCFSCFNFVCIVCFWWKENVGWWVDIVISNDRFVKNFFLVRFEGWKLFRILNNIVVVCWLLEWSKVSEI